METTKLKKKIVLLQLFSFLLTTLPLILTFVFRWEKYVVTESDTYKLAFGGGIILILLLLKSLDKLKLPSKRIFTYLFLLLMCYLLSNILNDATFIIAMATLGEVLDLIFCQYPLKSLREKYLLSKSADLTSAKVEEKIKGVLENYTGGRA